MASFQMQSLLLMSVQFATSMTEMILDATGWYEETLSLMQVRASQRPLDRRFNALTGLRQYRGFATRHGENYVPTEFDGTNHTCDGTATTWGRKGQMTEADTIQSCAQLCSAEPQCRFVQYQPTHTACHLYKDCETTRSCDRSCARTLARQLDSGSMINKTVAESSSVNTTGAKSTSNSSGSIARKVWTEEEKESSITESVTSSTPSPAAPAEPNQEIDSKQQIEDDLESAKQAEKLRKFQSWLVEAQLAQKVAQEWQAYELLVGEERLKHYGDRMHEAELRMNMQKLKRELEEQLAIARVEKWKEEVEDAQEDLLEHQLGNAETPEIAQSLATELEKMETQEKNEEADDQAAMKSTHNQIDDLNVEIEKTKASLETMVLQNGLEEMTAKEKVKKEHVKVEQYEKDLKAQRLQDDIDEAKATERAEELQAQLDDADAEDTVDDLQKDLKEAETEAGAAAWKNQHTEEQDSQGDNYVPTEHDNTDKTCDGSATFWGRKGQMSKTVSLEDCAKLCSQEVQCRFIQFQSTHSICHMYKDCESTRSCDNTCARTLAKESVGVMAMTPAPKVDLHSMPYKWS